MSFSDIPVRKNGDKAVDASWWNTIRTKLVEFISNPVKFVKGTEALPGITFEGDEDTGIYSAGGNRIGLSVGGVAGLQIRRDSTDAFANIGLGGPASLSNQFPMLISRNLANAINVQIDNPSSSAAASSRLGLRVNGGTVAGQLDLWGPSTVHGYTNRMVLATSGSAEGMSMVFFAGGDLRFYDGGAASGDQGAVFEPKGVWKLLEQALDPSTPSSGFRGLFAKADGFYQIDDAGNVSLLGSSSGGGGAKNYFENPEFENNADDVSTFKEATYADGAGGTASVISATQNTTTPIEGSGDLEIAKTASDGSEEGVSFDSKAIGPHAGRDFFLRFEWDGTDANYASEDLKIMAYAVTDDVVLPVIPITGALEDTNGKASLPNSKCQVLCRIPSTSATTAIRVSFHLESDSATSSAWSCFVDNFEISPQVPVPGTFTPSYVYGELTSNQSPASGAFTNIDWSTGSVTDPQGMYDSSNEEFTILFDGEYNLFCKAGLDSIDVNGATLTLRVNGNIVDQSFHAGGSGSPTFSLMLFKTMELSAGDTVEFQTSTNTDSSFTVNADSTNFKIERVGGPSAQISNTEASLLTAVAKITGDPASATSGNPIIVPTVGFDTAGGYDTSTGLYTVKTSGKYMVHGSVVSSASAGVAIRGYVNASNEGSFGFLDSNGECSFTGLVDAKVNDTISIRPDATLDASSVILNIQKIPDLTVFAPYRDRQIYHAESATLLPGSSGIYMNAACSVKLPPGKFKLLGTVYYSSQSGAAGHQELLAGYRAADGSNNSTNPALITTLSGLTVDQGDDNLSWYSRTTSTSMDNDYQYGALVPVYVTLTESQEIFLVPYWSGVTAANARIKAWLTAEPV